MPSFCFLKLFLKATKIHNKPQQQQQQQTVQNSTVETGEVNRKHLFPIGEEHLITEPPLLPPNLSCYIFC